MNEITTHSRRGISNSTLKIIAITAMLIDHIGAVILEPILLGMSSKFDALTVAGGNLYDIYYIMRMVIGRTAFPIFCFLLVEGFCRTSDVRRYAARLFVFALISELPFNLAFQGSLFDRSYQNVFLTLFIGLCVMIFMDCIGRNVRMEDDRLRKLLIIVCDGLILLAGMSMADWLCTDYGGYGVLCMTVLYVFRHDRRVQLLAGTAAFMAGDVVLNSSSAEFLAPLGFLAAACYNGEKGMRMKYGFYAFYPVHLLILYAIQQLIL